MNEINATNSVNPTNPMNSISSTNSVDPTNPVNSVNATNPINASNSSNPSNPSNPMNRLWYVIQTKPGDAGRVETNLLKQEIETFLPLLETYQYCGGKMIQKVKPLFTNYLFARLNLGLQYYNVKWTRGVNKILGSGNEPIPVSEKVIQVIRERSGKDNLVRLEDELKDGDLVQVTSGPLKSLRGVFQKMMSSRGRVRILLSLIGVDVPVQMSKWQIKKVA
jgi:transcriptional antiterminator RfaH